MEKIPMFYKDSLNYNFLALYKIDCIAKRRIDYCGIEAYPKFEIDDDIYDISGPIVNEESSENKYDMCRRITGGYGAKRYYNTTAVEKTPYVYKYHKAFISSTIN